MQKPKIVFSGNSRNEKKIVIRYPTWEDLHAMHDYINTLSKEQTFILAQGEEISLEEEQKFLASQLEKIAKHLAVFLLAFSGEQLIGTSGIEMKKRASAHEGVFGISLREAFRSQGIGKIFMQTVLDEAEKELPQLKIITLGIFANNLVARRMYEKLGFKKSGVTPKGVLHRGKYIDHIYMYKFIRDIP